MRFGVGAKKFEDGEFSLRTFTTTPTRKNGVMEKVTVVLDVEFEIIRDTQATITARFKEIFAAVRSGRDVGFYEDGGGKSAIFIENSKTASGVLVTQYPSLTFGDGADYATHHKGSCGFLAELLPESFGDGGGGNQQSQLTDYRESVVVLGNGGPRTTMDVVDRGSPRRYVLADRTPVLAQQAGSLQVVGKSPFYPSPNAPLWPQLLVNEGAELGKDIQPVNEGGYRMTVSWNYQFESAGPLFGSPRAR